MKFCLVLLLAFVTLSFASNVVDLDPDNFDDVVDGSKHVFVEFFAPWCGHCKRLAPEYEVVADAFVKEDDVVIAKVDADQHKTLGSRFGVSGFPTLKFFKKGSTDPEDYSSGRSADEIVNWVNGKAGTRARIPKEPSSVNVLTPDTFDAVVLDSSKDVFVEFYAPWCGHCKNLAPTWEKFASAFATEENVVVANLDADAHKDLAQKYGVTGFPTLIFFSKDNKEGERYSGGRDLKDLVTYMNENAGTQRNEDGTLFDNAGRVEALDEIAGAFLKSDDKEGLQKQAEGLVEGEGEWAVYYVKYMKVIQKRGNDWVESEKSRLGRLLEGDISLEKRDEFTVRRNILEAF